VVAAAAMRSVLATVADLARLSRSARGPHERVLASIERLRRDWRKPHRLEELAVDAGMSVTYYSALFRRCTGFAPIDFIIRERMQHACRLLDTTDARIGEIAAQCGYADAYYFTRCFRRVMGASPRRYREVPKG
jgi:transcriptional regulator GlxA family with amidase domain